MPADTFYGAECELRVGAMADAATDPATWENLPFVSLQIQPTRERRDRPQLGLPRHNVLDPVKPIPGFSRVSASLVVDGDARRVPRWLRYGLGAPTTTGPSSGIYTHTWNSGSKTPHLFAIQLRTAADQVRVIRGLSIATLGMSGSAENTRDFNFNMGLRGLSRARVSDWIGSTPDAMVGESLLHRVITKIDGVAASSTLESSWSWDRGIVEDAFQSAAAELSGLRPGVAGHTGSASFRAVAEAFDDMEEADTVFAAVLEFQGVTSGHKLSLEHGQAMLAAPALDVNGPGLIERSISWVGHQSASNPAGRIIVANNVASYAS